MEIIDDEDSNERFKQICDKDEAQNNNNNNSNDEEEVDVDSDVEELFQDAMDEI